MIKKKPFHPPQDEMHALEVRQDGNRQFNKDSTVQSRRPPLSRPDESDLKKRGMQCSCPCKQEEQNKQREKQEQKQQQRKERDKREAKQKQNTTRAGGAGGPEAEQLHAYTCDGQCNCAHASKSTQDIHRPKNQHYETTRASDTSTFAKSVSLKKYIACMYV